MVRIWRAPDATYCIGGYKGQDATPDVNLVLASGFESPEAAMQAWQTGFEVPPRLQWLAYRFVASGQATIA